MAIEYKYIVYYEGDLYLVPATDITIISYPAIKKLHALLSDFIKEMEHEKNTEEAITALGD